MTLSHEVMLEKMMASDVHADGQFITGVLSTGIYCLPSCPARKPHPQNVQFFRHPSEAAQAGLRPCLRCCPDLFYLPAPEQERLADQLCALHPRDVPTVAAAAGHLGVTQGFLRALVRQQFHLPVQTWLTQRRVAQASTLLLSTALTEDEAARQVGFLTPMALRRAFREAGYPSPDTYAHMPRTWAFMLPLPSGFLLPQTLSLLARDPTETTARVRGHTLQAATELPSGPACLEIELRPRQAHVRLISAHTVSVLTPADAQALLGSARRILGLGAQVTAAERALMVRPGGPALLGSQRGLPLPLTPTDFDGLIWAVVGQQVTYSFACELRRRLLHTLAEQVTPELFALPTPARLVQLAVPDLTGLGFTRARADLTLRLAREACRLNLSGLAAGPVSRAARVLQAIPGFGPWSTQYVLLRTFGFLDAYPATDAALRRALQRHHNLPRPPDERLSTELMSAFAPYRGLATLHFWRHHAPLKETA